MTHITCPKCNTVRNPEEAPECPVCPKDIVLQEKPNKTEYKPPKQEFFEGKMMSRQMMEQIKKKREGKCVKCNAKRTRSAIYCNLHQLKQRVYSLKYYKKSKLKK